MSSRDKIYAADAYYHVYNRGVEKRVIYKDGQDYSFFVSLLQRYLDPELKAYNSAGVEYPCFSEGIELLAYCLMPNHFHLLVYTKDNNSMTEFMRSVATSYVRYFNDKYERVGPLFQDRYKAKMIINEAYLLHISRYIHLNPKNWREYQYSSLPYWLRQKACSWVSSDRLQSMTPDVYMRFMCDHEDYKASLAEVQKDVVPF